MSKAEKSKTKSAKKPEPSKKSPTELLKEYRFKLNLLRIQHKMGNLPSQHTHQLPKLRKNIARLLTQLNAQRQKNPESQPK